MLPLEPETYRDYGCVLRIFLPARGIVATQGEGLMTDRGAGYLASLVQRVGAEEGPLLVFHDWYLMPNYEFVARVRLTKSSAWISQIQALHVLVSSRWMFYGAKMSSIVLGDRIVPYSDREPFERALADALVARGRADLAAAVNPNLRG